MLKPTYDANGKITGNTLVPYAPLDPNDPANANFYGKVIAPPKPAGPSIDWANPLDPFVQGQQKLRDAQRPKGIASTYLSGGFGSSPAAGGTGGLNPYLGGSNIFSQSLLGI